MSKDSDIMNNVTVPLWTYVSGGEMGVLVPSLSWTLLLDFAPERDSLSFAETLRRALTYNCSFTPSFSININFFGRFFSFNYELGSIFLLKF